ncbi:MAG: SAM-dependent methyltransferase [Rhodobacteraceae bacterium]|nr:MAG: SAM-dependent methyltransferase [Paracoccaceae bacterium]
MSRFELRPGELRLDASPAPDAALSFIGRIESPWSLQDCPKNLHAARERGTCAALVVAPAFRPALDGIAAGDALVLLYWMSEAPRDLLRQFPRHRDSATGTFNLRSPVRPNPIGLGVVRVLEIDIASGRVGIDAIDAIDGTPLIDIKPVAPRADCLPD